MGIARKQWERLVRFVDKDGISFLYNAAVYLFLYPDREVIRSAWALTHLGANSYPVIGSEIKTPRVILAWWSWLWYLNGDRYRKF